ncbi:Cytochrome c [Salinihabitans flavidus]|uniref:Cytochrome c n=1 Tax=Salinihabitans flavidus TaxID=569882 RepID=A0A1H8UEF7_9RHOB|nr:cytochrome c [Salinihabitans flavidus]SEP01008.1 Cytochrome c [Salinihabitans flavidus]
MKVWLGGLGALALFVACTEVEMPTRNEGAQIYTTYCATCHGPNATGNAADGVTLKQAPADLTRIAQRNGGTFPRAEVLSQIDGYTREPVPGMTMPEFGELMSGDLVPVDVGDEKMTPTPRKLAALMYYLESIQQ